LLQQGKEQLLGQRKLQGGENIKHNYLITFASAV